MGKLAGKRVLVVGGTRGLGKTIAERAHREGADVMVLGRDVTSAIGLVGALPGLKSLTRDATDENVPGIAFATHLPDILVLTAGAIPPVQPLQSLSWEEFSVNWEADVKASFLFCREALRRPLNPGSSVFLIASGAAIGGSPISGGYAGAKRMQMFMAKYAQKEADRLDLKLRFVALAPARIMPETGVGQTAVAGYARYLGMSPDQFLASLTDRQTPDDVADQLIRLCTGERSLPGSVALVTGSGLQPVD
jgi:NAD(P)-dependent dehydrogenase (short-subunit alcohol dehydrogenase family)